jgi:hypothetical protein
LLVITLVLLPSRRATTPTITPPEAFAFGLTPDWPTIDADKSPKATSAKRHREPSPVFREFEGADERISYYPAKG